MSIGLVLAVLQNTPWWVWVLLATLTLLGVQASRPRRMRVVRALITPGVFVAWGLASLASRGTPGVVAAWLAAAALGAALGLAVTRLDGVHADRALGLVELPGSWVPLVRNLAIFAVRYGLAVAAARAPTARGQLVFWDLAVSGLSAGYFLGWLAAFVRRYRRARLAARPDAAPVAS
jgi:hypothetical protein